MVKVILTNNANSLEKIVDEGNSVEQILNEAGFSYGGATLTIQGTAVSERYLSEPLAKFINGGENVIRITAVPHKANA